MLSSSKSFCKLLLGFLFISFWSLNKECKYFLLPYNAFCYGHKRMFSYFLLRLLTEGKGSWSTLQPKYKIPFIIIRGPCFDTKLTSSFAQYCDESNDCTCIHLQDIYCITLYRSYICMWKEIRKSIRRRKSLIMFYVNTRLLLDVQSFLLL